jgi:hypothetical protein
MKKTTKKKAAVLALSAASAAAMMAPMTMPAFAASSRTPGAISKVAVSQTAKSKVTVTWKKAANAKYYRVYTTNGTKYVRAAQTKATRATLNVKRGKTLKVKVRGVNGSKLGRLTAAKAIYVKADPSKPSVKAEKASDGSINVSWAKDKNADKYTIYTSFDGKSFSKAGTTTADSATIHVSDAEVKAVKVSAANKFSAVTSDAVSISAAGNTDNTDKTKDNTGKTDTQKGVVDGKQLVLSRSLYKKTIDKNTIGKTLKIKSPVSDDIDTVKVDTTSVDWEDGSYSKVGAIVGGTRSDGMHYSIGYSTNVHLFMYNIVDYSKTDQFEFANAMGAGNAYLVKAKAPYQIAWTLDGTRPEFNQSSKTGTSEYVSNEDGSHPTVQLRGTYNDGKEHILSEHIDNEDTPTIYWAIVYDKNGNKVAEGYSAYNVYNFVK